MSDSEIIQMLSEIRDYLTAGNPVWDTDMVEETMDVAISDVMSVRHGRWYEKHVDSIFGTKHILTCSECGGTLSTTDEALPYEKYCRECGAKMDGKEQSNERTD